VLWGASMLLAPWLAMPGVRSLALLGLILLGIASYFGAGFAIGAFRWAELRTAVRRG